MKTTLTIDRDGTAHIPLISKSGFEVGTLSIQDTIQFGKFAHHNEVQMGEIISEDTMEVFLKDHPIRTTLAIDHL